MDLKVCTECGAKNRIERFKVSAQAKCGRCGTPLIEPLWIHFARGARKYAVPIGILCSVGLYYAYDGVRAPIQVQSNYVPSPPADEVPPRLDPPDYHSKPTLPEKLHKQCTPVPIAHGLRERYTKAKALAPFRVETKPGGGYFIVLINDITDATVLTAYTSGGTPLEMKVPLGTYRVNYAFGNAPWCGETELFGESTEVVTLDSKLSFKATKSQYEGHVISLIRQVDGNLATTAISPKQLFGKGAPSQVAK